jgi:DNA mismatch endonuclease, patch repair protein
MADVFTKAKRSEVMSRIRSRGNRDTELALARLLRANGITGWRRHVLIRATVESSWLRVEGRKPRQGVERRKRSKTPQPSTFNPQLAVRPDFVFLKSRTAIFVDGCFWHGCPKHATWPAHRAAWWRRKIEGNKTRDRVVNRVLRRAGWRVLRIWEHELQRGKHPTSNVDRLVQRIRRALERLFSRNGTRQHTQKRWPTPKPGGKKTKELARKLRLLWQG